MGRQLMAIVAEGISNRVYLSPCDEHVAAADRAIAIGYPETALPEKALGFRVQLYGMTQHHHLFSSRQLKAITTFSDLIGKARRRIKHDAIIAGLADDGIPLHSGGKNAHAYSDTIAVYLGCALSRLASYNNSICRWNEKGGSIAQIFTRQAVAMLWDYIECNPLEKMSGNWMGAVEWVTDVLKDLPGGIEGNAVQMDASTTLPSTGGMPLISTDPPYYDNIWICRPF